MRPTIVLLTGFSLLPVSAYTQVVDARAIASRANRAVVAITATLPNGDQQTGTGFFVRANGTLVTNYHVIEGASSLSVALPSGEIFRSVYFLAADSDHDLAILRVPVASPALLVLGSDAKLEVGDRVYAMSNPLGLDRTFSEGILSSKRLERGVQLLQITAPISHGSSGGPIMDASGKVVGVATLISREGQSLNWAVPVRYVAPLLELAGSPTLFTIAMAPRRSGLVNEEVAGSAPRSAPNSVPTATSESSEAMRRAILDFVDTMDSNGVPITLTHEIGTGSLRTGETRTIPVELDEGVSYSVIGMCDRDCSDLDLALRQLDGTLISSDTKADKFPIVSATVRRTGKFHIVVAMAACSIQPCWYGLGIYTKR